jgi:hypothetical protein
MLRKRERAEQGAHEAQLRAQIEDLRKQLQAANDRAEITRLEDSELTPAVIRARLEAEVAADIEVEAADKQRVLVHQPLGRSNEDDRNRPRKVDVRVQQDVVALLLSKNTEVPHAHETCQCPIVATISCLWN